MPANQLEHRTALSSWRAAALDMFSDERGATLVEYALMLVMIALACFLAVQLLGSAAGGFFADAAARVSAAGS